MPYVCETGSHMFDWPEQYHMSPNATLLMLTVWRDAVVALIVKDPPGGVGLSNAFQVGNGVFHGLYVLAGLTPKSSPKGCAVTFSLASTV